jgi:hypothetical protein
MTVLLSCISNKDTFGAYVARAFMVARHRREVYDRETSIENGPELLDELRHIW